MSLDQVCAAAERYVGDTRAPGLVALVAVGEDVRVDALGRLGIGRPPVQPDSLFRIASVTKPITAAATLAVIEEGLVALDEPVDRLLPELADRRVLIRPDGPVDETVPAARPITVRDLLTFTFGFGMIPGMFAASPAWPVVAASDELKLSTIGPPNPDVQPDPDTWIAGLGSLPLIAQPGERWLYNTGASVLGVLLARATGEPFGEVLRTRLFEPLGMRDTAFWTSEAEREMTREQLTDAQKARGGLGPSFFERKSWGFCQMVYDSGAFGWNGGFGTSWLVDPAHDLAVIVCAQRLFESPDLPPAHRAIQAAAYAALD